MTRALEPTSGHESKRPVLTRILLVTLLVLILDLGSKLLISRTMVLGQIIELIPGLLNLHYIKNSGAAFGIGTQWPEWTRLPFFVVVFGVAAWVLYSFYQRCSPSQTWLKLSLGLVAGGALGNMADRLVNHRVTDFINVHLGQYHWPFFNVADMAITVGVIMLFLEVWILEGRRSALGLLPQTDPGTRPAQQQEAAANTATQAAD